MEERGRLHPGSRPLVGFAELPHLARRGQPGGPAVAASTPLTKWIARPSGASSASAMRDLAAPHPGRRRDPHAGAEAQPQGRTRLAGRRRPFAPLRPKRARRHRRSEVVARTHGPPRTPIPCGPPPPARRGAPSRGRSAPAPGPPAARRSPRPARPGRSREARYGPPPPPASPTPAPSSRRRTTGGRGRNRHPPRGRSLSPAKVRAV